MKTGEDLSYRIKTNILHALQHPKMWFESPTCMETHMLYLTDLLSFLHESEEGQYGDYLVSEGFQSAGFTTRVKEQAQLDDDELFARFCVFFKGFFDKFYSELSTR